MLKRNGKLGSSIAEIEPGTFRNQNGDLPTEPCEATQRQEDLRNFLYMYLMMWVFCSYFTPKLQISRLASP